MEEPTFYGDPEVVTSGFDPEALVGLGGAAMRQDQLDAAYARDGDRPAGVEDMEDDRA